MTFQAAVDEDSAHDENFMVDYWLWRGQLFGYRNAVTVEALRNLDLDLRIRNLEHRLNQADLWKFARRAMAVPPERSTYRVCDTLEAGYAPL